MEFNTTQTLIKTIARDESRTRDLRFTIPLLYQLSYTGNPLIGPEQSEVPQWREAELPRHNNTIK